MRWFGVVVVAACWLLCSAKSRPKSVTTLVDAKWPSTPILLEVAEYLAEESQAHFWGFVDSVSEFEQDFIQHKTDQETYEFSLSEASRFISLGQLSFLKLSLSLRNYSVTVETHHQMALDRHLPEDCLAVADINGKLTCDPSAVEVIVQAASKQGSIDKPEFFLVDHRYSDGSEAEVGVVLYGEIGTDKFKQFHQVLKPLAEDGKVDYILRHYLKNRPERKTRLSGYGVELQIKSTEYKAQDDTKVEGGEGREGDDDSQEEEEELEGYRFTRLKELYPDSRDALEKFKSHLIENSGEMAPLKVWQLQELSLQAAQRILSHPKEEAIKVLAQISQNFPVQARSLVKTVVPEELRDEIKQNREYLMASMNLHPTDAAIFVNGMFYDAELTDVFTLVDALRQELKVLEGLHKIGVEEQHLSKLLSLDMSGGASEDYAVDIRDSAVVYLNDIEQDKQYRRWPSSVMDMLRPSYPGMLKTIRRNMYHLVLIVDPSKEESKPLLKMAEAFVVHNAPLRTGIVFAVNSDPTVSGMKDAGVAMLNAFNYVSEVRGERYHGLSFLTDVYAESKEGDVTVAQVKKLLKERHPEADIEDVLGEGSEYDVGRQLARDFVQRVGLRRVPQALLNGVPLPEKDLEGERFEEAVLTALVSQTSTLQRAVFKGELTDDDIVIDWLMGQPNVMPRLNERILYGKGRFLDITGDPLPTLDWSLFTGLSGRDMVATLTKHLNYVARKVATSIVPVTNWIVTDVETPAGRELLRKAMDHMRETNQVRLSVIPNPASPETPNILTHAVYSALESLPPDDGRDFVYKIIQEHVAKTIQDGSKQPEDAAVGGMDMAAFKTAFESSQTSRLLPAYRTLCQRVLQFRAGQRGVVSNGKVIGPLDDGEGFEEEDFNLLERLTLSSYGNQLVEDLKEMEEEVDGGGDWGMSSEEDSDKAMKVAALLSAHPQAKSRSQVLFRGEEHSVIHLQPKMPGQPALEVVAILDPVSRGAQKLSTLLSVLQDVVNCRIRIFLNCLEKHSEMPLRSFYRFVLEPELQFDSIGALVNGPIARFSNMPESPVLTQNLHVPEHWLTEVVRAAYDLDNIHLEEVDSVVHSEYELEYLLVEGQCHEQSTGTPPRGLQITLGTAHDPVQVDTIVMANLGYLQLKAQPGAWVLRLRQGRSSDIYHIVSHENTDTPVNSTDIRVVVSSFRSLVVKLKVAKRPGKEHTDLLYDDDQGNGGGGIWNTITSSFGTKEGGEEGESEDNKINIFSVASGHLYERLLRIMMLSVVKHTKTPVKFWFLKNYLSPMFKDFLPHMAREYGFEYELVQYKWPRWLHQQTEKQRLIWGYKILFLDVLFPLDVRKIIFVDADQVVRADLKDLRDLDLGGAPYGYTPFCDSRKEMDGFRFWSQGYWKSHLQGRKYHISALYVVDLRRFRRVAAGDRLRGQYQALSMDPNSLSNLDQDLPNNMIHQVAIKSLPQEWLWCETWCNDDSKKYAKTIDLCNNPLTKESKLTAAMRIISEWKDYDMEVKKLQEKVVRLQRESQERERLKEEAEEAARINERRSVPNEGRKEERRTEHFPNHDDL